jgi:DNA polymerase-3 subunit alpha
MVIGTDAHYLKKEDRFVHKAYLNSKGGEREVDAFYEYAYLQTEEQIQEHLADTDLDYDAMVKTSEEIYSKIENYSLEHKPVIPVVEVEDYNKNNLILDKKKYPNLYMLKLSDNIQERYWVNECVHGLISKSKPQEEFDLYMERLEIEADVIRYISKELGESLCSYFNTMKHYIDTIWENGSIVGPGRGSATGFLSNYLLGITQLDPIKWTLPWSRLE